MKFNPEISDQVNASFSERQGVNYQPASYEGVASGLNTLAKTGVKLYNDYKIGELNEEMAAASEDFLKGPQGPQLSAQEIAQVEDVSQRMKMLEEMASSTGRQNEFRTRAEALLKKHIADSPHLATELRRSASGILGFDPTGESIRQQSAALQAQQQQAGQVLDSIYKEAEKYGVNRAEMQTLEGQQRFELYNRLDNMKRDLTIQKELAELMKNDGTDPALIKQKFIKQGWEMQTIFGQGAQQVVTGGLEAFGLQGGLTQENLDRMAPEQKQQLIQELEAYKIEQRTFYRANSGDMTRAEYDKDMDDRLFRVDQMIEVINGEKNLKLWETGRKTGEEVIMREMMKDPDIKSMYFITNKLGLEISEFAGASATDHAFQLFGRLFSDNPKLNGGAVTEGISTEELTGDDLKVIGKQLKSLKDQAAGDPTKSELVDQAYTRLIDAFSEGKAYDQKAMNGYIELLNDPANVETLARISSADASVMRGIDDAMSQHVSRLSAAAAEQIPDQLASIVPSTRTSGKLQGRDGVSGTPGITFGYKDGKFVASADYSVLNNDPRGVLKRRLDGLVNRINNNLLSPVNKTIKANSNLMNRSMDETAQIILKQGFLRGYLPKDEETGFNPDADGVIRVSLDDLNNYGG